MAHSVVHLERPHRFKKGDKVRHVDDRPGSNPLEIVGQTLRVVWANSDDESVAYPTYTIVGNGMFGRETVEDVLCTDDLRPHPEWPRS